MEHVRVMNPTSPVAVSLESLEKDVKLISTSVLHPHVSMEALVLKVVRMWLNSTYQLISLFHHLVIMIATVSLDILMLIVQYL
jgi:hypothetical protein